MTTKVHHGSCHCGAVRFELDWDADKGAARCNCSICTKLNMTGAHLSPQSLRVVSGEANLGCYEWGAKISKRYFCTTCGTHVFARGHLAEMGGDYAAFNVNALDGVEVSALPVVHWDGRHDNWQAGSRPSPWPIL